MVQVRNTGLIANIFFGDLMGFSVRHKQLSNKTQTFHRKI